MNSDMEERGERRGGIFRRGREESRPPPVEGSGSGPISGQTTPKRPSMESRESSLSELKLIPRVKSPEPIVRLDQKVGFTSDKAIIQPYREYTIVLAKDSKQIQILDRQGRIVEGLTNTQTTIFDWPLYKKGSVMYITDTYDHPQLKKIREFPVDQQQFLKDFYEKNRQG